MWTGGRGFYWTNCGHAHTSFLLLMIFFTSWLFISTVAVQLVFDFFFFLLKFCQFILLFILFLLIFMGPITLFGTIHRSNCTIPTNIYLYL